jgi:BioD-like phosphotransacetylase family protein
MKKYVIASMRPSAGKTSIIIGLAKSLNNKFGYMKPLGDRMLYRKKRLWDHDSVLVKDIYNLVEDPEDMSIGFEHSKLRYMYDEKALKLRLREGIEHISKNKDTIFIEGGKNLRYGTSVNLDPLTLSKYIDGELIIIVSGNDGYIMDDIAFLNKYVNHENSNFKGIIINKVQDVKDFKLTYVDEIIKSGINILGIIPDQPELRLLSMDYLSYSLFAKVITGEDRLTNIVKNIFVASMAADLAVSKSKFKKENRLIISSGDRSDIILAAIDNYTAGILLTNNILPPSNIISKVTDHNIPLLLVSLDTYQATKQVEILEPLLTKDNVEKINLITDLVKRNVNID